MGLRAETDQLQIDRGTVLSIHEAQWQPGTFPTMSPGEPITICLGQRRPFDVTIVSAHHAEIVIELPDQTKWRMAPSSTLEKALAARTGGAPARYWTIKEKVL